jgi:enoyl-CoA hydratase/carnithine racemase
MTFRQAQETGLVRQADTERWPEFVLNWLERFVSPRGASKSIGYAKFAVVHGASLPPEAGMIIERHLQEQLFRSHDGPEGMKAYLEKRTPVFRGE